MRLSKEVTAYLVWIGLLVSSLPADAMPGGAQQSRESPAESNLTTTSVSGAPLASPDGLPDSPGAMRSGLQDTENQQSSPETQSKSAPAESQSQAPAPSLQKPVGTAAAGRSRVSGIAASQPTGVAVAPAKQRRVRTVVLRFGAVAAAGAAVVAVVALSRATPSKPPGAR